MKKKILFIFLTFLSLSSLMSQPMDISNIVEVTGMVLTRNDQNLVRALPFTTVSVKGTDRGTYANYEGMFSIVVKKGETVSFSGVGYSSFDLKIPEDYQDLHYSVVIELQPEDVNIAEVLVFPWPDRDNFRAEFLAMEPTVALQMQDIAKKNLNRKRMMEVANNMKLDSRELGALYLREQASSYAYMGQVRPMPIFDPLAWARFFKQLNEDRKRKKEENKKKIFEDD